MSDFIHHLVDIGHKLWSFISTHADLTTALATLATAVIALLAILFAGNDAREGRKQQSRIFQGTVMSACMQEYFSIRNEAAKDLRGLSAHASQADKEAVYKRYSERVYGLHFEQYHLFRQGAIPCHVYAIWLKGLFDELKNPAKRPHSQYPPVDISEYTAQDPEEDFHRFFDKVQKAGSRKEVEDLVEREKCKGGYD